MTFLNPKALKKSVFPGTKLCKSAGYEFKTLMSKDGPSMREPRLDYSNSK
jgi:hypothetical protein